MTSALPGVFLLDHAARIAACWGSSLLHYSAVPGKSSELRQFFYQQTTILLATLTQEPFDPAPAYQVGQDLIGRRFTQPDVLALTYQCLGQELERLISPEAALSFLPRLTAVFGQISAGYTRAFSEFILAEQEQIRLATDVARQQAELERQKSENIRQAILKALPDDVLILSGQGTLLDYHTTNLEKLAIYPGHYAGKNLEDLSEIPGIPVFQQFLNQVNQTNNPVEFIYALQRKEGVHQLELRMIPMTGDQILVLIRDITEKVEAENALRASEARYRAVVEDQSEFIMRWLPDGTFSFVNDAFCRFFGKSRAELIGHAWIPPIYKADLPVLEENMKLLAQRGPDAPAVLDEHRVVLDGEQVRWLRWIHRSIYNQQNQVVEYQSVGRDVTSLRYAEENLTEMNQQLRQMTAQLINAHEAERTHLARELHDDVLSHLAAMLITLDRSPSMETAQKDYQVLVEKLRRILHGLRPPMLNYGLFSAMEELCDDIADRPGNWRVPQLVVPRSDARFDPNVELHLFRIIQEACENSLRHASAEEIRIEGHILQDEVDLTVIDDGRGFIAGEKLDLVHMLSNRHFGLASMLERGMLIGGKVHISSEPQQGARVNVHWNPTGKQQDSPEEEPSLVPIE